MRDKVIDVFFASTSESEELVEMLKKEWTETKNIYF